MEAPRATFPAPERYQAPAVDFEKETQLTGISTAWVMPFNMNYSEAQAALAPTLSDIYKSDRAALPINPASKEKITDFYNELRELNPSLKRLDYMRSNPVHVANIIHGAISQFNINDIEYFNRTKNKERLADKKIIRQENIVAIRANASIGWMPSPQTLKSIQKQMDRHPAFAHIKVNEHGEHADKLTTFKYGSIYADTPSMQATCKLVRIEGSALSTTLPKAWLTRINTVATTLRQGVYGLIRLGSKDKQAGYIRTGSAPDSMETPLIASPATDVKIPRASSRPRTADYSALKERPRAEAPAPLRALTQTPRALSLNV